MKKLNTILYLGIVMFLVTIIDRKLNKMNIVSYNEFKNKIKNEKKSDDEIFLSIMTYNIRHRHLDINSSRFNWPTRKQKLYNNIYLKNPDILSVQEDSIIQLTELINEIKEEYNYIGKIKNNEETQENNVIFYKKEKYENIDYKLVWLNPKNESGRIGWDAKELRSCNIAIFKIINDEQKKFIITNCHLDHKGRNSKLESIKMVVGIINDMQKKYETKLPVFIMGDFNEATGQNIGRFLDTKNYKNTMSECLNNKDCYVGEKHFVSFHIYQGELLDNFFIRNLFYIGFSIYLKCIPTYNRLQIDFIYYLNNLNDNIKTKYYSMPSDDLITEPKEIYASDHYPLFGVFKIKY